MTRTLYKEVQCSCSPQNDWGCSTFPFENRRASHFVISQKLVLDVQKARLRVIFVCALYLPRLFAKRIITKGKQHNFFTNNQLSHKTRKNIFRFIYQNVLFGLGQFNPNKIKYIESPNLKLAGIPKGRALWQRGKEREETLL